ncbi:MAG TPA: DinB family protein [Terrimesophilobacter sp.]|nr:DinB family protein [Terrimesophilobacter sp.]HRQ00538.1 DinB family protein [Terrimesophilobacter sp.]
MTITPDTKDWTFVLERACPECGFDAHAIRGTEVADALRESIAVWPEVLRRGSATERPNPQTWSSLEYACHVRDVCRVFLRRLNLMLGEDNPTFDNWDQDKTAIDDSYAEQDPSEVSAELIEAGLAMATGLDAVPDDAWGRTGRRSDGATFTIDSFSRYLLHDAVHHVWDVNREW